MAGSTYTPTGSVRIVTGQWPITAPSSSTLQVWVSANRTDGLTGTGLFEDPFNASTAALFDTLMTSVLPGLGSGLHVHFLPGTYNIYGGQNTFSTVAHGFNLPGGNWYHGAGIGLTIFKAYALPDSNQWYLFQTYYGQNNVNTIVSDATFDTNWPSLSAPASSIANHIQLHGDNCQIHDVEILHGYGSFANSKEAFNCGIANWQNSGVNTPVTNGKIFNCRASSYSGDYGQAFYFVSAGATSTLAYPGYNSFFNNYCNGYNGGATSISAQMCGMGGTGFVAYNNVSVNCDKMFYTEGPISSMILKNNHAYGCRMQAISFNVGNNNQDSYYDVSDNEIEVSNVIVGQSGLNGAKWAIAAVGGTNSGTTPTGYVRVSRNRVRYLQAGVSTATRAKTGGTVTITFATAPNLFTGDRVDITGLGGTNYNGSYIALTKVNSTTYTYTISDVSTEAQTADTNGVVGMSTVALNVTGNQVKPIEVTDNTVDDLCYNIFNSSYPVNLVFRNNLTFTSAPILLQPSSQNSVYNFLPNTIEFPAVNNTTVNGTNLTKAITQAASIYPNNVAPSASNRIVIKLKPGTYSGNFTVATNFVDLVGDGQRDSVVITSSGVTVTMSGSDFRLKTLSIVTTSTNSCSINTDVAAFYYPSVFSASPVRIEDCVFSGAGTNNAVQAGRGFYGTVLNCSFVGGGTFGHGQGQMGGVLNSISVTGNDTHNLYIGAGGLLTFSNFAVRLDLYRNDGTISHCNFIPATNTNACYTETANGSSGTGVFSFCKFVVSGTGKTLDANAAQSYAIHNCALTSAAGTNITNLVTTPYNVTDTHVTQ